jgi:hypothetical protein
LDEASAVTFVSTFVTLLLDPTIAEAYRSSSLFADPEQDQNNL